MPRSAVFAFEAVPEFDPDPEVVPVEEPEDAPADEAVSKVTVHVASGRPVSLLVAE
jgi:hypothetical protein